MPDWWKLMIIIWTAGWACWVWARAGSGHTVHRAWQCIPPLWVVLQVWEGVELDEWQTALSSWERKGCPEDVSEGI